MNQKAKLEYDDKTYEMPIVEGSYAERAIDIRSLRKDTGLITLDSGYMNTGATTSQITYINGEEGILLYRGYPIEQLAEKSSFVETSYLLIYGELPRAHSSTSFRTSSRTTACCTKTCAICLMDSLRTRIRWRSSRPW